MAAEAHVAPIDSARWQEAQAGELEFWKSEDRSALARYLDKIYAEALGITPESVAGLSVLDIGGGPYPMAELMRLPVGSLTVLDPLPWQIELVPQFTRVPLPAEDFVGPMYDEVWGYNVLQHVRDPGKVLQTAKDHAALRVRWYDWVDSKIEAHHPHSLKADWLIEQFAGWRLTVCSKGSVRVPKVQHYCAIVAEKP